MNKSVVNTIENTAVNHDIQQNNKKSVTRYKAKIDSVSPQSVRSTFEEHSNCFLGVSLENSNFKLVKLKAIVEWISRRFSSCTVLIGDSIHRLTLASAENYSPEIARSKAIQLGKQFVLDSVEIFDRYKDNTSFKVITCNEIQQTPEYEVFYNKLKYLFETNEEFKNSVTSFSKKYHTSKINRYSISAGELVTKINTSVEYFLEEFAIFACLKRQQHSVMVYPGSFSTLKEITQGLHPDAPIELKELIVVSLCMKGR